MRVLLVAYDNGSFINYFPLGLAYVAATLRKQGHDVEVYSQDVYKYPESHLTHFLAANKFDVVGVGMCAGYYQYDKLKRIVEAVDVELWVGGHMVSAAPEYFEKLTGAKIFCGEFENEEIDNIPYPSWDLFPIDYYSLLRLPRSVNSDRCFPVLSGRGCPFRCNFCYRMEEGYRARDVSSIVEEVQILISRFHVNYIDFADELLMINPDRTMEISEALKPLGIKWMCNGRLNYAKENVLKAMRDAGCVFINYGIESVSDDVLYNMDKQLSYHQIRKGVEQTLEVGISPGLNIIWGNIGDTKETLWKSVEFLLEYDDHEQMRTIRPVTPYPGSPLFDYAVEQGLVKDVADFYENKCKNSDLLSVNFTDLTDKEFHDELYKANVTLIERYYKAMNIRAVFDAGKLYAGDTSFRGFRQI